LRTLTIGIVSVAVLAFGLVPAQATTEYVASQKTLTNFSSSATGLTTLQRSQVGQAAKVNAYAEKFIHTVIRLKGQPVLMSTVQPKSIK